MKGANYIPSNAFIAEVTEEHLKKEEAAAQCVALGATQVTDRRADPSGDFIVLLDPEGNEFCVVMS